MSQEAAHKLKAWQSLQTLATLCLGTHRESHLPGGDSTDALIADGRAVRVTAQVLQHLGRTTQSPLPLWVQHPAGHHRMQVDVTP
jgi:hypothetical protein